MPVLTKAEADLCDRAVFTRTLRKAQRAWNDQAARGVARFDQLPAGWQTVWLSRFYQEGSNTHVSLGKKFRLQATQGKWTDAIEMLRSYTDYKARARTEAALLEVELPPDPSKPKAKAE